MKKRKPSVKLFDMIVSITSIVLIIKCWDKTVLAFKVAAIVVAVIFVCLVAVVQIHKYISNRRSDNKMCDSKVINYRTKTKHFNLQERIDKMIMINRCFIAVTTFVLGFCITRMFMVTRNLMSLIPFIIFVSIYAIFLVIAKYLLNKWRSTNRNNRYYPYEAVKEAIDMFDETRLGKVHFFGEVEHPMGHYGTVDVDGVGSVFGYIITNPKNLDKNARTEIENCLRTRRPIIIRSKDGTYIIFDESDYLYSTIEPAVIHEIAKRIERDYGE